MSQIMLAILQGSNNSVKHISLSKQRVSGRKDVTRREESIVRIARCLLREPIEGRSEECRTTEPYVPSQLRSKLRRHLQTEGPGRDQRL